MKCWYIPPPLAGSFFTLTRSLSEWRQASTYFHLKTCDLCSSLCIAGIHWLPLQMRQRGQNGCFGLGFPQSDFNIKVNYSHKFTERQRFKSQNEFGLKELNTDETSNFFFTIDNAFLMCKQHKLEDVTWQEREQQRFTWTITVHLKRTWKYFYPVHGQNKTLRLSLFSVLMSQRLKGKYQHAVCFSHLHLPIGEMTWETWGNGEKQ